VPNESRDIIWERFIQASEKVHERKKEYLNGRKAQEQENLQKKLMVLEVIAPYQTFNSDRINDWRDKTDEIQKIKDQWDKIGLVPKENADEVNKRFWSSYKAFYQHKNAFFKQLDEQKMQNLRHKTELCEQAEALKDSTDWDATKERLIQLQKKWKTIGRVPDKYSDKIWNRFRAACNEFFDRKQNQQQQKEADLERAASEKSAFYDTIATRLSTAPNTAGSIEEFNSILTEWRSFDDQGNRPNPKLEERFFDLLQKYLDTIPEMGYEEKSDLLFKLQLDRLRNHPDAGHKLYQKEQNIRKEISTLENDISTLRTNIEFFARSKNAEKLRTEYQARIDDANTRMATLKRQLKALRS
jgi:polyhydroxyalkanoate synthesis regulator phasin